MRYYRYKRGLLYLNLSIVLFTGLAMLLTPHRMNTFNDEHDWFMPLLRFTPFILLVSASQQCIFYFLSYVETLPDSLDSRHLWRRKNIPYSEISRISPVKTWYGCITVNLRYSRVRNLAVFVDRPADFLADIAEHAPQAGIG